MGLHSPVIAMRAYKGLFFLWTAIAMRAAMFLHSDLHCYYQGLCLET